MKIVPVFPLNLRRKDADRAFIYFFSAYHRIWVSGELRKALAMENVTGVSIRYVFEKTLLAEARQLVNIGFYLKKPQVIDRFCVMNFNNVPKLPSTGVTSSYFLQFKKYYSKLKMETPPQVVYFWMSKISAYVVEQFLCHFRPPRLLQKIRNINDEVTPRTANFVRN